LYPAAAAARKADSGARGLLTHRAGVILINRSPGEWYKQI
jgi:hypothetical protein